MKLSVAAAMLSSFLDRPSKMYGRWERKSQIQKAGPVLAMPSNLADFVICRFGGTGWGCAH